MSRKISKKMEQSMENKKNIRIKLLLLVLLQITMVAIILGNAALWIKSIFILFDVLFVVVFYYSYKQVDEPLTRNKRNKK